MADDFQDLPATRYPRSYSKSYARKLRTLGRGYEPSAPDWAYGSSQMSDELTAGERKVARQGRVNNLVNELRSAMKSSSSRARSRSKRKNRRSGRRSTR